MERARLISKARAWSSRQIAAVLTIVALLTAVGIAAALGPARPSLHADVCIDPQALKELSGLDSDFEFDIQREAGFIASPRILDLALRRPEIAELELIRRLGKDAARQIGRRIRVEVAAAGVLRISCTGERSF